jgi:hypothetical protein
MSMSSLSSCTVLFVVALYGVCCRTLPETDSNPEFDPLGVEKQRNTKEAEKKSSTQPAPPPLARLAFC